MGAVATARRREDAGLVRRTGGRDVSRAATTRTARRSPRRSVPRTDRSHRAHPPRLVHLVAPSRRGVGRGQSPSPWHPAHGRCARGMALQPRRIRTRPRAAPRRAGRRRRRGRSRLHLAARGVPASGGTVPDAVARRGHRPAPAPDRRAQARDCAPGLSPPAGRAPRSRQSRPSAAHPGRRRSRRARRPRARRRGHRGAAAARLDPSIRPCVCRSTRPSPP